MSQSRAAFKEIGPEFRHGTAVGNDTGFMTEKMGYHNPGPTPNLRGVEANTNRQTGVAPTIANVTNIEYAPATDQPEVIPYDTYEDD